MNTMENNSEPAQFTPSAQVSFYVGFSVISSLYPLASSDHPFLSIVSPYEDAKECIEGSLENLQRRILNQRSKGRTLGTKSRLGYPQSTVILPRFSLLAFLQSLISFSCCLFRSILFSFLRASSGHSFLFIASPCNDAKECVVERLGDIGKTTVNSGQVSLQ